jgi:hypothetical protein
MERCWKRRPNVIYSSRDLERLAPEPVSARSEVEHDESQRDEDAKHHQEQPEAPSRALAHAPTDRASAAAPAATHQRGQRVWIASASPEK